MPACGLFSSWCQGSHVLHRGQAMWQAGWQYYGGYTSTAFLWMRSLTSVSSLPTSWTMGTYAILTSWDDVFGTWQVILQQVGHCSKKYMENHMHEWYIRRHWKFGLEFCLKGSVQKVSLLITDIAISVSVNEISMRSQCGKTIEFMIIHCGWLINLWQEQQIYLF